MQKKGNPVRDKAAFLSRKNIREVQIEELLSRWKEGDRSSGDIILKRFYPELMCYARRLFPRSLRRRADTADLVQDACTAACQSLNRFTFKGPKSFSCWLFAILEHRLWRRWRMERAQVRDIRKIRSLCDDGRIDSNQDTPSECVSLKEDILRLEAAVSRLSPPHRKIVTARYLEGLSWSEIAVKFEKSKDAVQMLLVRALKNLQKHFKKDL